MDVAATASGGLITAPSATAVANPMSGSSDQISSPVPNADPTTSSTDSAPIVPKSRRKSTTGTFTAAAYRIGGRTTTRIQSGSTNSSGAPGSRLHAMPTSTSSTGAATPSFGAAYDTATMISTATTASNASSCMPRLSRSSVQSAGEGGRPPWMNGQPFLNSDLAVLSSLC